LNSSNQCEACHRNLENSKSQPRQHAADGRLPGLPQRSGTTL
jgi:hypothetical protein